MVGSEIQDVTDMLITIARIPGKMNINLFQTVPSPTVSSVVILGKQTNLTTSFKIFL